MRTVPTGLQAHLDEPATTTTRLLRVELRDGTVYGLTMLDQDIVYDDGDGELTYVATNGFDSSVLSADTAYSVDNAETQALLDDAVISDDVPSVTVEMVETGQLDDATWRLYLVNFRDLGLGHIVLDAGDLGQVKTIHGMVWIPELLSHVMRLRQPVGTVYSRVCRAIFGTASNSPTGCGFDTSSLWVNGTVTSVGAESNRTFTGDVVTTISSSSPQDPFPGRLQFLTGQNSGLEVSIEAFDAGEVTLNETTPYAVEIGDTYRIRPDCAKRYLEDCIAKWDNGVNFKGEPYIPVGDAAAIQAPGGQLPGGGGFKGVAVPPTDP